MIPSNISRLSLITVEFHSHVTIITILVFINAVNKSAGNMDLSGLSDDDEPRRDETKRKAEARKELKKAVEGG